MGRLNQNEGPHQEPDHASTLISDLLDSRTERNEFLFVSHPVSGWSLQQPKLAKTTTTFYDVIDMQ